MVTRKRARTTPKKYMIVVEQKTEKRGLTWSQAQGVKSRLNKKIGKRKGTVIKVVPY